MTTHHQCFYRMLYRWFLISACKSLSMTMSYMASKYNAMFHSVTTNYVITTNSNIFPHYRGLGADVDLWNTSFLKMPPFLVHPIVIYSVHSAQWLSDSVATKPIAQWIICHQGGLELKQMQYWWVLFAVFKPPSLECMGGGGDHSSPHGP